MNPASVPAPGAPAPGVTRAEYCVIACAEAWRDNGEVLASPMGPIPSIGARLAKRTFSPDLLLTDGEAMLVGLDGTPEGWLPYRQHLTMVTGGRRHVMMGASHPGTRRASSSSGSTWCAGWGTTVPPPRARAPPASTACRAW
jgi:hypothetical protein